MRKYLSTGLFGTILGLAVGTPADASLVSRGFLDEALENYATTTALDLKANQSDLTTLSDIIGTPAELTYWDILAGLENASSIFFFNDQEKTTPIPTNDISEFLKLSYTDPEFPGVAGIMARLFKRQRGDTFWPVRLDEIFHDYEALYNNYSIENGFSYLLSYGGNMTNLSGTAQTVYGLPKLTEEVNKIGTVPDGYETVGAALTAIKGIAEDAKAAALSAIPDPKAEGSTGKFVLTVDIVGDNATYRWEKIDRESETTTTTNE